MTVFRDSVEEMVVAVEQGLLVSPDLSNFVMQLRAYIEMDKLQEQKDPGGLPPEIFYPGLRVFIASGPFGGNYGKFIKLVQTPFKDQLALVTLDEAGDTPVETRVDSLRLTS